MRRISPAGGGGGKGAVIDRSMPKPIRQMPKNNAAPTRNQMMVPNMVLVA